MSLILSDAEQYDEASVQPESPTGSEVSYRRSSGCVHRNTGNTN